ncbi:hypothetical protein CAPTEDRAFT_173267 [Capitella teleta]|uniref:non-chaperonin molecular chaperone ATPase n=1 Tax=Capitella teleta TaxID=283909 RepID=R7UW87_CAPTE|nr:hypothetical protein CAPTEDRAFT_173267 [Capitella teleta]|eukprot:ELU08202.1 hypothetical protein CAPTEDRAFT_173267 [Capitella teleta]
MSTQLFLLCNREKKEFMKTGEFTEFLSVLMSSRYFSNGSDLKFSYYGQPCELCVRRIQSAESCIEEKSIDCLAREVKDLTIEPSSLLQPDSAKVCHFYSANASTHISIEDPHTSDKTNFRKTINVGGLEKQRCVINEMIDLHLHKSEAMNIHGLNTPRGVLIYGPSGTGKTLLAKSISTQSGVHFVEIQGAEIWSRFYGESESRLTKIFREAKEKAPAIVFIDEIDALCPKRSSSNNEVEKRVIASLLTIMDELGSQPPVFFIAATNKRDLLDPALRRPGRLDREVETGVPSAPERALILSQLIDSTTHMLTKDLIQTIADKAHGFVGADLAAVCKEGFFSAGIRALKRQQNSPCMIYEDLLHGLNCVQPSAMREVAIEVPDVSWSDIGGQGDLKQKLRQAIEWPLKHPEAFLRLGIRPPRGLLMYGPPGCSKTMIAKALARESGINFIAIKGPELFSKWVGESERAVRELFRKARSAAPAIIFFDEIDALAGERGSSGGGGDVSDRVLAQLLTEIDGVEALKDVTIVAATNRPDRIDKALLRPGRLDRIVYVSLPDEATRKQIFLIRFKKTPTADDVNVESLVERTAGYSGAEVAAVCQEAALHALQEDMSLCEVHERHFDMALDLVKPRITQKLISFYDAYAQSSGLHAI